MPNSPEHLPERRKSIPERRITGNLGWIDALLDAVVVMGADGIIRQWNRAAERTFGWSAEVAVGSRFVDLCVPPHLRVAHIEGLQRYIETGEKRIIGERIELPAIRSDGVTIAVELTITTARGGPDNAEFFVGFMREVTALRIAEERAELGEQRLRAIVEHAPSIISLVAKDGSWESPGTAGAKILGWPKGINPEGGIFSLVHPDDLEYAVSIFEEVTSNARNSLEPATFRIRAADGSWHWFETTAHNMLNDPAVQALVLHSRDITESRATELLVKEHAERLSAVVENLTAAVLVEDAKRRIVVINQRFADLFDISLPLAAILGQDSREVTIQSGQLFTDPEFFLQSTETCLEGRKQVLDIEILLANGRLLERDYIPIFVDDRFGSHVWIYRDITDRRDLETRRENLLIAERDVRHVIEEQNLRLRELDQLKSEFVANVSHELRTPLTSILGFTEILSDGAAGELASEQQEYLEIIERSGRRMLRLIDDLLLLSRLETRSIEVRLEAIDLASLVQEAVVDLSLSAEQAGVSLVCSVEGTTPLNCDRERIRQIIDNLLNNAIKFTPRGGAVTLSIWREPETWIISVADNGMGIPEDDLENLFKKFFRASNADPKLTPGTGLGLTISKAIVESHSGTISVESTQGSGTTFTVRLPD